MLGAMTTSAKPSMPWESEFRWEPLGLLGGWNMEAIRQLGTVGNETLYTVNVMFFFWGGAEFRPKYPGISSG